METPILSKVQQSKALSSKKSRKETIKNVLDSPYVHYWPLLTMEDDAIVNEVLVNNLVKLRVEKTKLPWNKLKNIPREQRKAFRKEMCTSEPVDPQSKIGIIFGINEVTKLLESNEISSIIISGDVTPQFLVKHIIDMAVLNNKYIVIMSKLREILRSCCAINSVIVAFKNNLDMDSRYWVIDQKVKEIHANYPVPENHINYNRRLEFENSSVDVSVKEESSESDCEEKSAERRNIEPKNFYLYRNSKRQRAFIPESSIKQESVMMDTSPCNSNDFLAFDVTSTEDSLSKSKTRVKEQKCSTEIKSKKHYNSLIVKRVRNNEKRNKTKIEILKQKK